MESGSSGVKSVVYQTQNRVGSKILSFVFFYTFQFKSQNWVGIFHCYHLKLLKTTGLGNSFLQTLPLSHHNKARDNPANWSKIMSVGSRLLMNDDDNADNVVDDDDDD